MVCRIYNWLIEKEMDDHGDVQSGYLKRHLDKCQRCQIYRQQLVRLENQLSPSESNAFDSALFNRMRAGLQQQLTDNDQGLANVGGPASLRTRWLPTAIRSVAAIFVLAAFAGLWQHMNRQRLTDSASDLLQNTQYLYAQASLLLQSPERPIQNEMTNLHVDVTRAVQFLRDCTPGNPYEMKTASDLHEP